MARQVSEQQKTFDALVNETNAQTISTTVWTNSHSVFTTSTSLISSSILLPGILMYLCKQRSSLGICACQRQPGRHVLCRVLQMLCCWTQTSSGLQTAGLNPEAKSADICFPPQLLGMASQQQGLPSMCERSLQLMKVKVTPDSWSLPH